jgi:hypothetical protein
MAEEHEVLDDGDAVDEPYLPEDDESDGELEGSFPMPVMSTMLDKAIVVDGLPQVPSEKYDKLLMLVEKIFKQAGPLAEDGIMMPKDPATGMSKGCASTPRDGHPCRSACGPREPGGRGSAPCSRPALRRWGCPCLTLGSWPLAHRTSSAPPLRAQLRVRRVQDQGGG